MSKLPVPSFAKGNPETLEQRVADDEPADESARVRSYPHERGQWTTHLYLQMPSDVISDLLETSENDCDDIHPIEEPHFSLSRGHFVLRFHQIPPFIATIAQRLKTIDAFHFCLDSVKVLENDDKTRAFVCLCDSQQATGSLNRLIQVVRDTFDEFSCASSVNRVYPEEFIVHTSLFWYLPSESVDPQPLVKTLQENLDDEPIVVQVDDVIAKIGNQTHRFQLRKR